VLGLSNVGQLSSILSSTPRNLYQIADNIESYVQLYELIDPVNPRRKPRVVLSPTGPFRRVQYTILHSLLRQHLRPTRFSFGGIPGRNAVQNARQHLKSRFAYTTDIHDFFPSISAERVRETFISRHKCSADVSRLLTRLCTYNHHLAQGLITSPILADEAVRRVDVRIAGLCEVHNLVYSRFVDDVTISGWFTLDRNSSGLVKLIRRILSDCGFAVAEHKEQSGALADGDISITGLRILRGHLDPTSDYIDRLEAQLEAHRAFGAGGELIGPLFTQDQLRGRVEYVCAINPNRARSLRQRLGNVNWDAVKENAITGGRMVCRKVLRPVLALSERQPEERLAQ
jgi:RNA-directed DNA polymerase